MTRDNIPEDVRRFILTSVPSIPHLEAILLLREETNEAWDGKRLASRLYLNDKKADELLRELCATGFLVRENDATPAYRYRPSTQALQHIIDRVADVYAKNIVGVTHLIHSNTSKQAQHFADAFKWRKDS